jgi:hypothetical protein
VCAWRGIDVQGHLPDEGLVSRRGPEHRAGIVIDGGGDGLLQGGEGDPRPPLVAQDQCEGIPLAGWPWTLALVS